MMMRYEDITSPILTNQSSNDAKWRKQHSDTYKKRFKDLSQYFKDIEKQYKAFSKSSDIIIKDGNAIVDALVLFIVKNPENAQALFQQSNIREFLFTGIYDKENEFTNDMSQVLDVLLCYNSKFIPSWIVDVTKEWLKSKGKDHTFHSYGDEFAKKGLTLVVE
jgi:hypothetical protein